MIKRFYDVVAMYQLKKFLFDSLSFRKAATTSATTDVALKLAPSSVLVVVQIWNSLALQMTSET